MPSTSTLHKPAEWQAQESNSPRAISGHKGRDQWMCAILTRDVLPLLEVRIAMRLGIFFNCRTGKCDPGYKKLMSELRISRRTLFRGIARLKADGWIEVRRLGEENAQFSLFIPGGANIVAPAGGANIVAPAEPSKQVTENEGAGATQTGSTKEPENLKEVSKKESKRAAQPPPSSIDRPSLEPRARAGTETPVQRPDGLQETVIARQHQPSRVNPIGTPADGARAAFEDVSFAWPSDRTDDEGYAAYVATLAAAQGDTEVVLDAIWERLEESGADPPWLSDALRRIEHDLRIQQARGTGRQ